MIEHRIQSWLEGPFDPETRAEIRRLLTHDPKTLSDAFFKNLSFGTGGMRGIMGVGTNRMNIYTVRMATQGLANYIKKQPHHPHTVFIGYDVRHHSREFAIETAKVFAGNGLRALLSKDICPTPLVSFACRHYGCSAAVMITASHNPPQYNGYKVYWSDGCQIVPPHDQEIMNEVELIKSPEQVLLREEYEEIGPEIDKAYLAELKQLQMLPALAQVPLKIVYTNLHGTGIRLIPKALKEWGYTRLSLVDPQLRLDGDFPNAPSPNPEEEKALQLGTEQLIREKGDILIATDPDADRIGLVVQETTVTTQKNEEKGAVTSVMISGKILPSAVKQTHSAVRLTGNQIACLCLHHICTTLTAQKQFPANAAFIKTIVTTELFKRIAEGFHSKCIDVLTGFKYIGEQIGIWEASFDAYQFLFGAEESCGYLFGTFVRDKDAISTACLIAEMAAAAKQQNLTLVDRLHQIYRKYGVHRESLTNLAFSDSQAGMQQMSRLMQHLRQTPPKQIAGQKVTRLEDYLHGYGTLPPSDVLRFWLADQSKLVIRPSGTEPKVKIYVETVQQVGKDKDLNAAIYACDAHNQQLVAAFRQEMIK